jgi:hypothetical protein
VPPFSIEAHGTRLIVAVDDITLTRPGETAPFFSLRAFETARFASHIAEFGSGGAANDWNGCVQRIQATALAFTGTLLSVRTTARTACPREAHRGGESRFVTFRIDPRAATGAGVKPIALPDLVDAHAAIVDALNKDALVREALKAVGDGEPPKTLADLAGRVSEAPPVMREGRACYAFPSDFLERFAPSHLDHGKLAVRFALPGAAACRHQLTEIGILVPLPKALVPSMTAGASGESGFLKRNAPRPLALKTSFEIAAPASPP